MRRAALLLVAFFWVQPGSAQADFASAWQAYLDGDHAAALADLRLLADGGDADAQNAMGTLYSDGLAVSRNFETAARWYERAAAQGHGQAQFSLGFLYYNGAGGGETAIERNPARARRWLELAANGGNPMAAFLLARIHHYGLGAEQDLDVALDWARIAAEKGLSGGQFEAGVLLGNRRSDIEAWIEAYKWLILSANQGHPAAAQNLAILGKRLNAQEIDQARSRAANWTPAR